MVNPNRLDELPGLGQLAAVGVAFLLVVAVNRCLRRAGWYTGARREPDLRQWLDLVALGTVCDVVPLTGVNRAFVSRGLEVMARRANTGLAALADVAGLNGRPDTYALGFILGPRVNAGGRVGEAGLGARLLATDDAEEALGLARRLDDLNRERREIEAAVAEDAAERAQVSDALVFAAAEGWHPGVIGIVASRLAERFRRPACVVAVTDGVGRGSGRSVRGVDLGAAVIAARQAGLLVDGGGHAMAAGFTVAVERLEELSAFLAERIRGEALEGVGPSLGLDGALTVAAASPALAAELERVGPFGEGNAQPRFAIAGARVVRADVVGTGHVRCFLSDQGGGRLKGIAFRSVDGELGPALLRSGGVPLTIAGRLRRDEWQGRESVELVIDDAAPYQGAGADAA